MRHLVSELNRSLYRVAVVCPENFNIESYMQTLQQSLKAADFEFPDQYNSYIQKEAFSWMSMLLSTQDNLHSELHFVFLKTQDLENFDFKTLELCETVWIAGFEKSYSDFFKKAKFLFSHIPATKPAVWDELYNKQVQSDFEEKALKKTLDKYSEAYFFIKKIEDYREAIEWSLAFEGDL